MNLSSTIYIISVSTNDLQVINIQANNDLVIFSIFNIKKITTSKIPKYI